MFLRRLVISFFAILIFMSVPVFSAEDSEIPDLPELTIPADGDLIVIEDISTNITKKITKANLITDDFGAATDLDANGALNTGCVDGNEIVSTAVTPGSYTNTDLTVDADGRITAAANGSAGSVDKITEGDSNVEVIDTGTGEIDFDVDGTKRADIKSSGLYLSTGARINEFSTDGTLAGDSDNALPTEKAVNTFVSASAWMSNAYYPDYNEADQGLTGNGKSAKAYIDTIASDSATLVFRHNSGAATTTYTFSTSETIPSNINTVIEKGAILSIDNGVTLTVNGPFDAGLYRVFSGNGNVSFGDARRVYVAWVYDGSDGDGAFQKLLNSLDGVGGIIEYQGLVYSFDNDVTFSNTPVTPGDNNTVPLIEIIGPKEGGKIQASAAGVTLFSLPGGAGEYNAPIGFKNVVLEGNSQTNVTGIMLSGYYIGSRIENCRISGFDNYGIDLQYNGENTDSDSILIMSSKIYENGVNFRAKNVEAAAYNMYGITILNTSFSLATGVGIAGIGVELEYVKDVLFINTVIQSSGMSGASYGYGYGLKITKSKYIYSSGKFHSENHDNVGTAYDVVITGTSGANSEHIKLNGTIKRLNLTHCNDVVIEGVSLFTITDDETAVYKIISHRPGDMYEVSPSENHQQTEHFDCSPNARTFNYKNGRINDESQIVSPWVMIGTLGNYVDNGAFPTNTGQWAVSNITKTSAQRNSPAGTTTYAVTDLLATSNAAYTQNTIETTWDGWKVAIIWMKKLVGNGVVHLHLRNDAGVVGTGYCQLTDEWMPYAFNGYDTSANAVVLRITLPINTDKIAFWNPIVKDGRVPGPGLMSPDNNGVADVEGIAFPAGAYFGWGKVGRVWNGTKNWDPGSVANQGQVTTTLNVPYVTLGDFVSVAPAVDIGNLMLTGHITGVNTVKIYLYNLSGGAIDPNGGAAFDVNVRVWE